MARIITVTSGKGGVGKTNLSVNLALYLAEQGSRTCLFDADMGLANTDIILGIYPDLTLEDVMLEKIPVRDILVKDYMGIDIVPGSSGLERMANPRPEELDYLTKALSELEGYDFLLIDTSAGISRNVVSFCMASSEIIMVVTPEPTSLTDAYSLLKILALNGLKGSVMVAVNQCRNLEVSSLVYSKFKAAVEKYLPVKISPLGTILMDDHVQEAVKKQKPFISLFPDSNAAKGIKNMGRHLLKRDKSEFNDFSVNSFWTRFLKLFMDPLQLGIPRKAKEEPGRENVIAARTNESVAKPERAGVISRPADQALKAAEKPKRSGESEVNDIPLILERLTQGISNISTELSAIREILENNYRAMP
ncbi:MAG: MinD/ParA family protein [Deltaproteobacteria bacterium]|nr:MinD/ParA family protein [Deltaproteobacteria bacterium]